MFITITLNPAIDTMLTVKTLNEKKQSMILSKKRVAGGKGINISKVLKQLGEKTFATGLLGGTNGKFIAKELSKLHIDHQFIKIDGETRENYKIFSQEENKTFEFNESGPSCDMNHFYELIILLKSLIKSNDSVIISGSAPIDFNADIYKVLIDEVKPLAKHIILDTSKDWFKEGLTAIPNLIKPNLEELKDYSQKDLDDEAKIVEEALKICDKGVSEVLVSLGKNGSLYVSNTHIYKIDVPNIEIKSTVGAGDALLAGFVSSRGKYNLEEALTRAAAISLAYISNREDIDLLQSLIKIKKL